MPVYDLLPPDTHKFAIIYDVTATREGAPYYLNPIRRGSVAENTTVYLSGVSMVSYQLLNGRSGEATAGSRTRSTFHLTSSLVNSRPECHCTPFRRLNLTCL